MPMRSYNHVTTFTDIYRHLTSLTVSTVWIFDSSDDYLSVTQKLVDAHAYLWGLTSVTSIWWSDLCLKMIPSIWMNTCILRLITVYFKFISIADAWIIASVPWRMWHVSSNLSGPGYTSSLILELRHQKGKTVSLDDSWSNKGKMSKGNTTQATTEGHWGSHNSAEQPWAGTDGWGKKTKGDGVFYLLHLMNM